MQEVLFSIGSNLGDKKQNIYDAVSYLATSNILTDIKCSAFYKTEPFGEANQDWFLNIALLGNTKYSPEQLLFLGKSIEFCIGRRKGKHWSERCIDIDILLFSDEIIDKYFLSIPHKYMCNRRFVLVPAAEIAPKIIHPIEKKTIIELLDVCEDMGKVVLFSDAIFMD